MTRGAFYRTRRSPAWNGDGLTVKCRCRVAFERWVTPNDAEEDLFRLTATELVEVSCHNPEEMRAALTVIVIRVNAHALTWLLYRPFSSLTPSRPLRNLKVARQPLPKLT